MAGDGRRGFKEFNAQNFNPFFDAADFIRVLLRFWSRHPALQKNPVIIVGESYGGTRATAMFHMLLNYDDYGNGREMFQDAALSDEIQRHLDAVFPERAGTVVPPDVIVRQFRGQVLIQPSLAFGYMLEIEDTLLRRPGSLVYQLGEEIGIPYRPGGPRRPRDLRGQRRSQGPVYLHKAAGLAEPVLRERGAPCALRRPARPDHGNGCFGRRSALCLGPAAGLTG